MLLNPRTGNTGRPREKSIYFYTMGRGERGNTSTKTTFQMPDDDDGDSVYNIVNVAVVKIYEIIPNDRVYRARYRLPSATCDSGKGGEGRGRGRKKRKESKKVIIIIKNKKYMYYNNVQITIDVGVSATGVCCPEGWSE